MRRSGGGERTVKEIDEARFAILKNAPRKEGEATADVRVKHNVFAVQLRNVRCTRCGAWGHQATDRECPMRDSQGARDEAQKARDDPMARHTAAADAEPLRWELKGSAVGAGVHGAAAPPTPTSSLSSTPTTRRRRRRRRRRAADIDPALLAALSEKQQRKLLKNVPEALAGGGDGGGDGDGGGGEAQEEKHKKEKKRRRSRAAGELAQLGVGVRSC